MIQIILVGAGRHAAGWAAAMHQVGGVGLVAAVTRAEPEGELASVQHHRDLGDALARFPDARVMVAQPPLRASAIARRLTDASRLALVSAPLGSSLTELRGAGDGRVRVSHGWTTLAGASWLSRLFARGEVAKVSAEICGTPDHPDADLDDALWHAVAVCHRLAPSAAVTEADFSDSGALRVRFTERGCRVELTVQGRGQALHVRALGPRLDATWSWRPDTERLAQVVNNGADEERRVSARPAAERAVLQLAGSVRGDTLADACAVSRIVRSIDELLPHPVYVGARVFEHAARITTTCDDAMRELGLEGREIEGPAPAPLSLELPGAPFEWFAFRAGLKPVAFLTVPPEEVHDTVDLFEGAHVERRTRRVYVVDQDRWIDRRDEGVERVELYLATDASLAKRAAELQAATDPTGSARELGELMGYPTCCVEAFIRQPDRSNNTFNRYATRSRTKSTGPWSWLLNNAFAMLVPFFPCRYDCPKALAWAGSVFRLLETESPDAAASLKRALGRPVLYFTEGRLVVLDGSADTRECRYSRVMLLPESNPKSARLARSLGAGTRLVLASDRLRVYDGEAPVADFERTDPALGFLAPFSDDPPQ